MGKTEWVKMDIPSDIILEVLQLAIQKGYKVTFDIVEVKKDE